MPVVLYFPAGKGNEFKKEMNSLVEQLLKSIPMLFESEKYQKQKENLIKKFTNRQKTLLEEFEKTAQSHHPSDHAMFRQGRFAGAGFSATMA